jgi:hypothetical protein
MDIAFFVAIAVGVVVLVASSSSRTAAAWKTAAQALGASFVKKNSLANPQIVGTVDGMSLNVSVRSSGNTKSTRYVVEYAPVGIEMQITKKRGLNILTEFLGAQDARTGDEAFDELVIIKTTAPDQLPAVLSSRARTAIMDLMATLPAAKVTDTRIVVQRNGIDKNANRIVHTAQRLLDTGRALGRRRMDTPSSMPADPYGTIQTATRDTTPPPEPEAVPPDEEMPPQDMAGTPMATSGYEQPDMPSTAGLSDVTRSSVLDDTLDPNILDQAPHALAPPTSVDPLQMAGELFGGQLLSFQAASVFDERYAGQDISWTGTVTKRSESQIRVSVGTIETTLYGPMPVEIVVLSTTVVQPGVQVVVDGTLTSVDTFERIITVEGTVTRA